MRNLWFTFLFLAIFGCTKDGEDQEIIKTPPLEIGLRETVTEIENIPAYLDVEMIVNDTETSYVFSFELHDASQSERLVPEKDLLICGFLDEQLMYGMGVAEDCALPGYYFRYLRSGNAPANYRMNVTISGIVKESHPDDLFTGSPIVLEKIEKISSCPVEITEKSGSYSLENRFWQLAGFVDASGNIISSPTCENPEIGLTFYDRLLSGTPIEDDEAKTFTIESAAWLRPGPLFLVYSIASENQLSITSAADPSWMPPRPATAETTNFPSLTKDIYNKYDSLSRIFNFNEPVNFEINGNKLQLHNLSNGISALFVTN